MRAALRPMPYRAVVLAIVRRLPLRLCAAAHAGGRNETDKRETRPPPVWAGDARFGMGARPAGRSHAAVHALTCRLPRAAVHTVMRCGSCARAPLDMRPRCGAGDRAARFLRLCAAAHAGGRNETDKQETRPPPIRAGGACFGTGCIRSGVWPDFSRRRGRRGDGARRAACGVRLTGLFSWRGWGGAPGMAAGPSVFCGAAGGAAWRGVWLTGLCAAM